MTTFMFLLVTIGIAALGLTCLNLIKTYRRMEKLSRIILRQHDELHTRVRSLEVQRNAGHFK